MIIDLKGKEKERIIGINEASLRYMTPKACGDCEGLSQDHKFCMFANCNISLIKDCKLKENIKKGGDKNNRSKRTKK